MKNIYGVTIEELENYFISINEKKFKAIQVYEWLYAKKVKEFFEMHNLKKDIINNLLSSFSMDKITIIKKETAKDVSKYLFKLDDNNKVEAVLMNHDYGNSLCISSQVGCNMGCTFCESGRLKKVRNLETFEMVLQIIMIIAESNIKITHIVLMGIGEPLDNYENVINFIKIINHPKSLAIGSRHITISTCGIIPKIKQFMTTFNQVNLAISLHAPTDELRSQIMPINKVYPLKELIEVVKEYIKVTNRRVTFEYIMLKNINDSTTNAIELSKLLKGLNCYVNLIPYNETSNIEYKKTPPAQIQAFYNILKQNNICVTTRREFGKTLSAACGQLRSNYEEE